MHLISSSIMNDYFRGCIGYSIYVSGDLPTLIRAGW